MVQAAMIHDSGDKARHDKMVELVEMMLITANSLRLSAYGRRHFRLLIVDCRFAGAVSREP
jgi:hypothetical protein